MKQLRLHLDEASIAQGIREGEEGALKVLLDWYWTPLVRYAVQFVQSQDQAEDIVQESFIRLWTERKRWKQEHTMRPVLYRITRNLALNECRRLRTFQRRAWELRQPVRDPSPMPDQEYELAGLSAAVQKAIDSLPARRREIFVLVRVHGMNYAEAARVLGGSPQTVANQVSRATKDLRALLAPKLREADPEAIRPFPVSRVSAR